MKKVGLADWQTSNGLPSASDPETEADRTPRESSLACMTANREPSNQSFETDREATVCAASRRFLPLCGRSVLSAPGRVVRYLFLSIHINLDCDPSMLIRYRMPPLVSIVCDTTRLSWNVLQILPFCAFREFVSQPIQRRRGVWR